MLFEESLFSKSLNYEKVVLDFGSCFLLDNYFIIEINEGVHFNLDKLNTLLKALRSNYGNHKTLAYISNRVYCYSIDPVLWSYFDKDDSILTTTCIVSYRNTTSFNAKIEKQMASIPIELTSSLEEAITWAQKFKEVT